MITMALLTALTRNKSALIMDTDQNPLSKLPHAQRFQIMSHLAFMWTGVFSAAFGLWFWYGQFVVAHLFIAAGPVLTRMTFSAFGRSTATATLAARDGRRSRRRVR